ncbi:MAG: Lrp/AsnC family transcriptional regulator [Pseudomonadales bacterium]
MPDPELTEPNPKEREILRQLQIDGRLANVELARRVGLSESPCFRRVKQLEQQGLITGYRAVVDQRKLGLSVTAFVLVTMEKQPDSATDAFHQRVLAEPHIVECHAMSGSHDYLMQVVARDMEHFSQLCLERILKFEGVLHVESSFSLRSIKLNRALPT